MPTSRPAPPRAGRRDLADIAAAPQPLRPVSQGRQPSVHLTETRRPKSRSKRVVVSDGSGATVERVLSRAGKAGSGIASSPLVAILEAVHEEFATETAGAVATYIPELARADPSQFGIAIATVDGDVFEIGDASKPFTIQSIS